MNVKSRLPQRRLSMPHLLHGIKFVAPVLILKLILDHVENVATGYVGSGILLADDSILTAAKVVALHTQPHSVSCLLCV